MVSDPVDTVPEWSDWQPHVHYYIEVFSTKYNPSKLYTPNTIQPKLSYYQWVKKVVPLKLFAIFSLRLSIFSCEILRIRCQFISTNYVSFGQFTLIFNKMVLIFLGVLSVFTISSFEFHEVKLPWLHRQFTRPQSTRPQSTELSGLGAMLESYHKCQPKPKTVPEFKDALKLIWSA